MDEKREYIFMELDASKDVEKFLNKNKDYEIAEMKVFQEKYMVSHMGEEVGFYSYKYIFLLQRTIKPIRKS